MRSRLALRKMVEERLSHPLLEQMKSDEFDRNPLAEDEALVVDEDAAALSRTLSGIHGLPTASSSRRTSLEDDGEPGEDAAVMAHDVTGEQHSTLPHTTSHHITTHTPYLSLPHRRRPRPR